MRKRTLGLGLLVLCAPLWMALRPARSELRIVASPATRSDCGFKLPMRVSLRALATPVNGNELTLEMAAQSTGLPGPYEAWIAVPAGMVAPLDGPMRWTPSLPLRQTVTWTTRIRVTTNRKIDLTAKVRSLAPGYERAPAAEAYLTLYPFEVQDGVTTAAWEQELRSTEQPMIKLPDGSMGRVYTVGTLSAQ